MIRPYRIFIILLLVAITALQFRLWTGQGSFAHVNGLGQQVALRIAENESKVKRNAVLKAEIKDLRHSLDAVEGMARSELGLVRKGETFYWLVEDQRVSPRVYNAQ